MVKVFELIVTTAPLPAQVVAADALKLLAIGSAFTVKSVPLSDPVNAGESLTTLIR